MRMRVLPLPYSGPVYVKPMLIIDKIPVQEGNMWAQPIGPWDMLEELKETFSHVIMSADEITLDGDE